MPTVNRQSDHRRAIIALLLLVPAPTIGVVCAMWLPQTAGTPLGEWVYTAAKVWLVLLPVTWRLLVDRKRLSWSKPERGGFGMGVLTGLAISAAIVFAYVLLGERVIDTDNVREAAERTGLNDPVRFLLFAAYICTINAALEEYVWRWFCFRQCERLLRIGWAAVLLSAALFTLHHIFALGAQFGAFVTILGSIGVFIGGCIWSWMYLRYRSIWPGFVSHVIVDIAVFAIGWRLIMQ